MPRSKLKGCRYEIYTEFRAVTTGGKPYALKERDMVSWSLAAVKMAVKSGRVGGYTVQKVLDAVRKEGNGRA